MDEFQNVIASLMFLLTIFQLRIAIESLYIQKSTNRTVNKIETKVETEGDIKSQILKEIQEDMDDTGISFAIAGVLVRSFKRRRDMGVNLDLEDIFNRSKRILEQNYNKNKKIKDIAENDNQSPV